MAATDDPQMRPSLRQGLLDADYMRNTYSAIREPLNLETQGQAWWRQIHSGECHGSKSGLVLGGTPWLASELSRKLRSVMVVDASRAMVDMVANELSHLSVTASRTLQRIRLIRGDWRSLPRICERLDVVVGDNSFNFMAYPGEWIALRNHLADRMKAGATLMVRAWSPPSSHRSESITTVVDRFVKRRTVNYPEVRAALLFAHWSAGGYSIDTEYVLAMCQRHYADFKPLFRKFPLAPGNDFVTMAKYRDAGAVYYAPPLPEIIAMFSERFHVKSVNFGPYPMSRYFPLIVASRLR